MTPQTTFDCAFSSSQFSISGFSMLYGLDRNSRRGGIGVHLRDALIIFKLKR